jgi:hypothetical protein
MNIGLNFSSFTVRISEHTIEDVQWHKAQTAYTDKRNPQIKNQRNAGARSQARSASMSR